MTGAGRSLIRLGAVGSTNSELKKAALHGAGHGMAVYALSQSEGRGRSGRSFVSPVGGVYLSVLWRPDYPPERTLCLMPSAAAALCLMLENEYGIRAGIKWPNDILLDGRKLAGILTEGFTGSDGDFCVVLGVGMNVNTESFPAEISDIAVSLRGFTGISFDIGALAEKVCDALNEMYSLTEKEPAAYLAAYRRYCITIGKDLTLPDKSCGHALYIGDDFSLAVRQGKAIRKIGYGEIN